MKKIIRITATLATLFVLFSGTETLNNMKRKEPMMSIQRSSSQSLNDAINTIVKKNDTIIFIDMKSLLRSSIGTKIIDCFNHLYGERWALQILFDAGVNSNNIDHIAFLDFNQGSKYTRMAIFMEGSFESTDFSSITQDTRFIKETVGDNEMYSYDHAGEGLPILLTTNTNLIYAGSSKQGRKLFNRLNNLDDNIELDDLLSTSTSKIRGFIAPQSLTKRLRLNDTINDAILNMLQRIEGKLDLSEDGAILSLYFESNSPLLLYFFLENIKSSLSLLRMSGMQNNIFSNATIDISIREEGADMIFSWKEDILDDFFERCKGEE